MFVVKSTEQSQRYYVTPNEHFWSLDVSASIILPLMLPLILALIVAGDFQGSFGQKYWWALRNYATISES